MKKKIVMAIAVLGMAFAGQVTAQDENARLAPPKNCKSYPSDNTGSCEAGTDGGAYCVSAWWFTNCR